MKTRVQVVLCQAEISQPLGGLLRHTERRTLIAGACTDIGSPFPPPSGHDASGHSRDSLFPKEGASGVHEVAIYRPGTEPEDINTALLSPPSPTCPPVPTINDPNNRLAIVSDQRCEGGSPAPTYTFNTPGRYLVICTFLPHFKFAGMYGWVTVRDR